MVFLFMSKVRPFKNISEHLGDGGGALEGRFAGKRIIIERSMVDKRGKAHVKRVIDNALKGKSLPSTLAPNTLKQLQIVLADRGLGMSSIIDKYKSLLDEPHDMMKASDVIKILGRLEKLNGITEKSIADSQKLPEDMGKAVEDGNVHKFIFEVTESTKRYLDKLEKIKSEGAVKVVSGKVIG